MLKEVNMVKNRSLPDLVWFKETDDAEIHDIIHKSQFLLTAVYPHVKN
jgi:hypothetical protein